MKSNHRSRAERIVHEAQEIKAERIVLFDVTKTSSFTNYIIMCEGTSQAHVKGIAGYVEEKLRKEDKICGNLEGYTEGTWILLDYGDVVMHIFHPETRKYYNLEELHIGVPMEAF